MDITEHVDALRRDLAQAARAMGPEMEQAAERMAFAIDSSTRLALVKAALRLGIAGTPPRPPAEESKLGGLRHCRGRDAQAIAHHYDGGQDLHELVPGPPMHYPWPTYEQ